MSNRLSNRLFKELNVGTSFLADGRFWTKTADSQACMIRDERGQTPVDTSPQEIDLDIVVQVLECHDQH
ncbi:MAG: hypothetical protein WBD20_22120 [Pirellulaceae bacterium]